MKILFLNTHNFALKHLHMAFALRDNTDHEIHFMHIDPQRRVVSRGSESLFIKDATNSGAFKRVERFSSRRFKKLKPDVIYVYDLHGVQSAQNDWKGTIILDIRDTELLNKKFIDTRNTEIINKTRSNQAERERKAVSHPSVKMCLFGSQKELELCKEEYKLEHARLQYPYVAKATVLSLKLPISLFL